MHQNIIFIVKCIGIPTLVHLLHQLLVHRCTIEITWWSTDSVQFFDSVKISNSTTKIQNHVCTKSSEIHLKNPDSAEFMIRKLFKLLTHWIVLGLNCKPNKVPNFRPPVWAYNFLLPIFYCVANELSSLYSVFFHFSFILNSKIISFASSAKLPSEQWIAISCNQLKQFKIINQCC